MELRDLIVEAVDMKSVCGFLNEVAPLESRLFIDIYVNKKSTVEITDEDMRTFSKTFNQCVSRAHLKEKGVFRFPDPTPQILVDGSEFQWYSHPEADEEMEILKRMVGRDGTRQEILNANVSRIDPATMMVLRSQLFPSSLATYHLIFPFLIGSRKESLGVLRNLMNKNHDLYLNYMRGKFEINPEKRETIFSNFDYGVLEKGYMRGYLQDKWDEDDNCPCPSNRPFEFMMMVSNGQIFD